MTPAKRILTAMTLSGVLALSACSSNTSEAPSPSTAPSALAPTSSVAPTTVPTASPAASASTSVAPTSETTPKPTASREATAAQKQIRELVKVAKEGKVPGVPYAAHIGLIEDVKKDWGEPDKEDYPAGSKGTYSTYSSKNAVIGWNKGSLIFDVRSNAPEIQKLTWSEVKAELGKPTDTKESGKDTIYIYRVSDQYELKFAVPGGEGKVDHISVFSPQDSINNMAG
ncbi:YjgB family protein [Gorillibacterium sp. CAU 1737]|uniref:YjgB family protein n=1 Tax=Gorillibacterium sp. CAU 1737 TaxID=3140362 RepID=UPI0032618595